jgi:hypothetical protein
MKACCFTSLRFKGVFVVITLLTAALRFYLIHRGVVDLYADFNTKLSSIDVTSTEVNKNIIDEDLSKDSAVFSFSVSDEVFYDSNRKTLQKFSDEDLNRANGHFCTWRGVGPGALECTQMLSKRLLHRPTSGSDDR